MKHEKTWKQILVIPLNPNSSEHQRIDEAQPALPTEQRRDSIFIPHRSATQLLD